MAEDPEALAEQLEDAVVALRAATLDRTGLSLTAAATLDRLRRTGPRRVTDLAAAEGVSQPTMTTLVNRLVDRGLVERARDPQDGRAVVLSVTDAGRDLLARRRASRTARLAAVLGDLPSDDAEAIGAALPALLRLAAALRGSSIPPEVTR